MKLIHSPRKLFQFPNHHQFSTKTLDSKITLSLFNRIRIVKNPNVSIVPILDQWVEEGNNIQKLELQSLVRAFKNYKRFSHALQISQWMCDRRYFDLSSNDAAIRLDLISVVDGPEQAEHFFNRISNNLKRADVYGALLVNYVRNKSVEKAEAVMQKMRETHLLRSAFGYNMMISLYSQTNEHEKIQQLVEEMEKNKIPADIFTVKNRMSAYVAASDISGMEKYLARTEENLQLKVDWNVYSIAAHGYLKVGSTKSALKMLSKMEKKIPQNGPKVSLEYLLTLYTSAGQKDELYRVWNSSKPFNNSNASYACMITCLGKLGDISGAEDIFHEWEAFERTNHDFRVLNRLVAAYCKNGFVEKAESLVKKVSIGNPPYAGTWNILAIGYSEEKKIPKALEMLKNALYVARNDWRPNFSVLKTCLEYLKEKGDIAEMEVLMRLYKLSGPLNREIYHELLRAYVANGMAEMSMHVLARMIRDGFEVDEETEKILAKSI